MDFDQVTMAKQVETNLDFIDQVTMAKLVEANQVIMEDIQAVIKVDLS